jgi:hypothetical protein
MPFTDLGLLRLTFERALALASALAGEPVKVQQIQIWSEDDEGLSILFSSGGTKSFMGTFYLNGRPVTAKLGRVGKMSLKDARDRVEEFRVDARRGNDPRQLKLNGKRPQVQPAAALGSYSSGGFGAGLGLGLQLTNALAQPLDLFLRLLKRWHMRLRRLRPGVRIDEVSPQPV